MLSKTLVFTAALTAMLSSVHGHGEMSKPKPQWNPAQSDHTAPSGIIDGVTCLPALAGESYTGSPESNTKAYTNAFKASQYKTLRDLVMAQSKPSPNADKECGFTKLGEKQPLPDEVEWSHGSGEGFTSSHEGPCEVWCDDERVFQDDNCARNFPQAPAKLKIDKAKCQGKSTLKTIWLALHSPQWQVYINCAALEGGQGGGDNYRPTVRPYPGPEPAPAPGPAPKPNPAPAPAPAPAPGPSDDCDEDLPEPDSGDASCGPSSVNGKPIDWNNKQFVAAFEKFATDYYQKNGAKQYVRRN